MENNLKKTYMKYSNQGLTLSWFAIIIAVIVGIYQILQSIQNRKKIILSIGNLMSAISSQTQDLNNDP